MKRRLLVSLWALLPILALALHHGPGQSLLARDLAADHLSSARAATMAEDYPAAIDHYRAARELLPPDDVAGRTQLEIAEARAQLERGELIEASTLLDHVLERELALASPRAETIAEVRALSAESSYYTAWMMRLEGAADDEWRAESDKARQQYRLLAETPSDPKSGRDATQNLEAVIRLEQMDLSELKALPLPKKCKCSSNCCQKKRDQRMSKCEGKSKGKKPTDARKDINTNSAADAISNGKGS